MTWREPAPGEREAGERSWEVVRAAFEERIPVPRRRDRSPLVALAIGLAILAAAFTPPGLAVLGSIRDAVRGEDHLLSLPTRGRLLVNAPAGAWVVQRDGSKRFLSGYLDATWSPHGLYLAAARANQLVALEPNGRIHWTIARTQPIGLPQWSYEGHRIAYVSGPSLRLVNGDGTGDRLLASRVGVTPVPALAWRPGTHELAYANNRGEIVLVNVDGNRVLWRHRAAGIERLLWADDGRRLLAVSGRPVVLDAAGRTVASLRSSGLVLGAAFVPRSDVFALAVSARGRSTVTLYGGARYRVRRTVFSGAGLFAGLAWSPDARWLLVDWRSADQWIFIRSTAVRRVIAVSNIGQTFDSGPEHYAALAGWCCP